MSAFLTLDASGTVLATTGGIPLDLSDWRLIADELRRLSPNGLQIRMISAGEQRLLVLSAPIVRPDQRLVGILVTVFEAELLARRIARPGSNRLRRLIQITGACPAGAHAVTWAPCR